MARAIFSGRHPSRLWPGPYFPAAIFRDYGPGHNFQAAILRDYGPGHIFRPPSFAIMARAIFSGRHLSRLWPGPYFPAAILRDYGPGHNFQAAIFRDYGPGHDQAPFFAPTRGPGHQSFRSFRSFRSNGATTGQTARDLPRGNLGQEFVPNRARILNGFCPQLHRCNWMQLRTVRRWNVPPATHRSCATACLVAHRSPRSRASACLKSTPPPLPDGLGLHLLSSQPRAAWFRRWSSALARGCNRIVLAK